MAVRLYDVSGLVKKGGWKTYLTTVYGCNTSDAKAIALADWTKDAHLFHLTVKRSDLGHSNGWHKTGECIGHSWVDYD